MNGIHRNPDTTTTPVAMRPTATSVRSDASGRSFLYTSIVNSVEHELKTAASELISAASNPPATSPRSPTGNSAFTITGKA